MKSQFLSVHTLDCVTVPVEPCPSKVFQDNIGAVLTSDNKLATQFLNSVLNQLNWAFSEFVSMIQEVCFCDMNHCNYHQADYCTLRMIVCLT